MAVVLFVPQCLEAAVSISEVAWMGSSASANHEWIELHNDGAAMDVTGWRLTDGANLDFELAGVVPAGAYVVLERTSDEAASGAAFLIYTGALVNTGATLRLERADGTLVDQVSGGENWEQIGGDNVTKETAQYTSAGWVTAAATPGRGITENEVVAAVAEDTTDSAPSTAGGQLQKPKAKEPTILTLPPVSLQLTVQGQTTGYVNQPLFFSVTPSGIGQHLIDSLQYQWNFGDGATSTSREVTHTYTYPGTYVVTTYASYKRQEQVARHEITILPVSVSLTTNEAGDVQLNNDSPYEVDLSGYRLSADESFVFPPRTILLPNQTITIPRAKLGYTTERLVGVYDAAATLLASIVPDSLRTAPTAMAVHTPEIQPDAVSVSAPELATVSADAFAFAAAPAELPQAAPPVPNIEPTITPIAAAADTEVAAVGAASPEAVNRWPYVGLAAVLLLATLGLYATPRRNQTE